VAEARTVALSEAVTAAKAAPFAAQATAVKISPMQMPSFYSIQKVLAPLGAAGFLVLAYSRYGWLGVVGALGALVMWVLLHVTRVVQVMRRAANRPPGYVDSAVMFNAKLRADMPLLHILAMTRALGEPLTPPEVQPEIFRWTDDSASRVDCEFVNGRLKKWHLERPSADPADAAP